MAKLSEAVGNASFLKVLAYGKSGAGKTVFGTTFPTPIAIADFDGKATSAANYWNSKDKKRLSEIDFENYMVSPSRNGAMSYRKFLADLSAMEKQVIEGKFTLKTYVIDSLTALADQMMASIIAENPGLKRTEAMTPVMQDWMIFTPHMKSLIYRVLSLPCNIVVIGHVLTEKDETTNMISNQISLPGKLPDLLPKLFGEVYYCHTQAEKDGKINHMALTKSPTEKFVTRTQIQGLPNIIPMDYEFIKSVMSKTESKE